jgi:MFS family permease
VAGGTGVSVSAAGQLVTASAGVTVLALVLFGPLSDRYGRRTMLALGLAAMAAAAFGSSLTSSYALLMAFRVMSGLGDALVIPSAAAAAADYFEGKDREVALNVLVAPMGAAAVLGLPAVILITDAAAGMPPSWRLASSTSLCRRCYSLLPFAAPSATSGSLSEHYRNAYGEVVEALPRSWCSWRQYWARPSGTAWSRMRARSSRTK